MHSNFLIGLDDKTPRFVQLAGDHFMLVDDGPVADRLENRRAQVLDFSAERLPKLNILKTTQPHHKFARDFILLLDALFPEGASTLTRGTTNYLIQNALRLLLLADHATLLDLERVFEDTDYRKTLLKRCTDEVVVRAWERILHRKELEKELDVVTQRMTALTMSPAVRALCHPTSEAKLGTRVIVRLDRAKLGDTDAFAIGTLLMGQFEGQLIVPDFGFYGRDYHIAAIRQHRLVAGCNYLSELSGTLQQAVLSIRDKTIYRTTREDAERLIFYLNALNPSVITDQRNGECKMT